MIIISFWLPLLSGSRADAKDDRTAKLDFYQKPALCSDLEKKQFIITFDVGNVAFADSLISYDLEFDYDPTKIHFSSALYTGTLTEGLGERIFSFSYSGKILGQAINLSLIPTFGNNKPLVAFYGEYLGDCIDTTSLKFAYIDFNEGCKISVSNCDELIIKPVIYDYQNKYFSVASVVDTVVNNGKGSLAEFDFKVDCSEIIKDEKVIVDISYNRMNYNLLNIEPLNEKIKIDSSQFFTYGAKVFCTVKEKLNNEVSLKTSFSSLINVDDTSEIGISVSVDTACSCFPKQNGLKSYIVNKGEVNSVQDEIECKENNCYFIKNNEVDIITNCF